MRPVLLSCILSFHTFATATPFHRNHDSPRHNAELHRKHLLTPADGTPANALEAIESKSAARDAALAAPHPDHELVNRSDDDTPESSWGNWRSWGPYRPQYGNNGGSNDSKTQLAQFLADLDAKFDSLLVFLAQEYKIDPPNSSPSQSSAHSLPTSQRTSSTAQTTRAAASSPLTSIAPIPLLATTKTTGYYQPSSSAPSTTASYTFNPLRSDLNVVYYAQSPATQQVSLPQLCADPSIDIIILAFVSHFFVSPAGQPSQYPTLNLASKCWAANAKQIAAGAGTLVDCVSDGFAAQVSACQAQGKKVMLSLGGARGYSNTDIPSEEKAKELAEMMWDLFLGGLDNAQLRDIRPLGDVVLDGIDIDNENPTGATYLPTLVSHLRTLFAASHTSSPSSKKFFLSAAPQCPRPDASIPIASIQNNLDFVMPQFYNNPECNLGSEGFLASVQAWSNDISLLNQPSPSSNTGSPSSSGSTFVDTGNTLTSPRLLIGTAANPAAGSGYVDAATYKEIMTQVKELGLENVGGAMFWDGAYVELAKQGDAGVGYAEGVREVMG